MTELSPTQLTPEQIAQNYATALNQTLVDQARYTRGDSIRSGADAARDFLQQTSSSLPDEQIGMIHGGLSELRRAQAEKDHEDAESADATMRGISEAAGQIGGIISKIERQHAEGEPVDSTEVARWLREEVYPQLIKASQNHEHQSEVVLRRYIERLPDSEKTYVPPYERVKPLPNL